ASARAGPAGTGRRAGARSCAPPWAVTPGRGPATTPGTKRSPAGRDQGRLRTRWPRRAPGQIAQQPARQGTWRSHARALTRLAVPGVAVEQPACLVHNFPFGSLAGVGEVAVPGAPHPLGPVLAVPDGIVRPHVRRLPHDLSASQHPQGRNGRLVTLLFQASATAAMPPSKRISGTSARRIPSTSRESTISMPKAFCPAATGTAAKALQVCSAVVRQPGGALV